MTLYTIKKGEHYSTPKVAKLFIGSKFQVGWDFIIDSNLAYNLNSDDQFDWNKLFGISLFKFIPNDKNSIRIGYRYITDRNVYELTTYYHVDGKIQTGKVITLPNTPTLLGAEIIFKDKQSTVIIEDEAGKSLLVENKSWNSNFTFAYENSFYFGGNQTAPNDLILWKHRI